MLRAKGNDTQPLNMLQVETIQEAYRPHYGICGNGVVPLVAAHALRTLAAGLLADG